MKQQGLRDFWTSTVGQQPRAEANNSGDSAPVGNGAINEHSLNVVPVTPRPLTNGSGSIFDAEKTGAILLFSGIFLGLVGGVFTTMGWFNYDLSRGFEWTQLLGPILLSVGGAFLLISVCKFRTLTCQSCVHRDAEEDVSESEQFPPGHLFEFNGIHQATMFHGATVVQYIPPPYASLTHDVNPANGFQPNGSVNGVPRNLPPQYYTVCPLGNPSAITADEDSSPQTETDHRHSR